VAAALARLVGAEGGLLAPSTLHLMWDLFDNLPALVDADGHARLAVHVDAAAYPIARWGVERAAQRGARVGRFAHLSAAALGVRVRASAAAGLVPVVVTDGFCPGCGRAAPLAAYQAIAAAAGGLVIVDDTQALGVLGEAPGARRPYGAGGGGTLRWTGAPRARVLVVASLAKAFGAPVAALLAGAAHVARFARASETRVHCSPPSAAAVQAAARALAINAERGDALRARLVARVARFRAHAGAAGLHVTGGAFPVQALALDARAGDPRVAHAALRARGTTAVLQRAHGAPGARLTFLITAAHDDAAVARAATDAAAVLRALRQEALCG
jgi:8-amino-7-oxononanoate synthase